MGNDKRSSEGDTDHGGVRVAVDFHEKQNDAYDKTDAVERYHGRIDPSRSLFALG